MKTNRKKSEKYRLNGHPTFHAESIHSIEMAELEHRIRQMERKLADVLDEDDKNWTARWLKRLQDELEKKRAGRSLKQREKRGDHRSNRG